MPYLSNAKLPNVLVGYHRGSIITKFILESSDLPDARMDAILAQGL